MISITRRFLLAVTLACSSVLMASASYADKIKVAAIYTLPVEQQWISRIHKALNTAASRGDIEYVYSENIANTDYERVMREYAEQGMQLIVGEVFGLERAARKVAKDYPDTAFLMGSSSRLLPQTFQFLTTGSTSLHISLVWLQVLPQNPI